MTDLWHYVNYATKVYILDDIYRDIYKYLSVSLWCIYMNVLQDLKLCGKIIIIFLINKRHIHVALYNKVIGSISQCIN